MGPAKHQIPWILRPSCCTLRPSNSSLPAIGCIESGLPSIGDKTQGGKRQAPGVLLILAHVVSTTDLEGTGRVLDGLMEIWTFGCLLMQHSINCVWPQIYFVEIIKHLCGHFINLPFPFYSYWRVAWPPRTLQGFIKSPQHQNRGPDWVENIV